jgi:hypothetical protein
MSGFFGVLMNRCLIGVGCWLHGLALCGVHCELEVPCFKAHLHLHLAIVRLKVASLLLTCESTPTCLEAKHRDIRVTVSLVDVSGLLFYSVAVRF